ncbi:MAG: hypothetical protein J6W03_01485 [Bacteroidaceae bacterium]|nr:hypothetical protein [Bacteroidaceae bacterium]
MKSPKHYLLHIMLLSALCSCDSGDIQDKVYQVDEKGYTVKVTARVSNLSEWEGTGYTLAVAGFTGDSKFALLQKALPSSVEDGSAVSIVLSNISSEVQTVEVSLTNSLRKRIISLATINMAEHVGKTAHDTIRLDLGTVDAGRFGVLQAGVFNRACIQCHGGNGRSAAGLNLTEGNAVASLVDVPSTRREGMLRVASGNVENSLLHQILNEGGENLLSHNHTEILSSQYKSNLEEVNGLIDGWIEHLVP